MFLHHKAPSKQADIWGLGGVILEILFDQVTALLTAFLTALLTAILTAILTTLLIALLTAFLTTLLTALWFNRVMGSEMGVAQLLALKVLSITTLEF